MATVYRNLQEQVFENAKDIEDLQANKVDSNEVVSIVSPVIDEKISKINTLSTNKSDLHVADTGHISMRTVNAFNSNDGEHVRGLSYYGDYLEYVQYEGLPDSTYRYDLPTKSGTLALVEDIPVNNGILKIGNTEITEEQLQKLLQLIQ